MARLAVETKFARLAVETKFAKLAVDTKFAKLAIVKAPMIFVACIEDT